MRAPVVDAENTDDMRIDYVIDQCCVVLIRVDSLIYGLY